MTGVVHADAADGSAPATPVDLTASAHYMIAQNDFTATGGDGYPNVASRMTTQDIMEEVVADYVTANTPINPTSRLPRTAGSITSTGTASAPAGIARS